jgi:hypothetical protein
MTHSELLDRLNTNFHNITQLLQTVSADDWTRSQDPKWSMAQEAAHLVNATTRIAWLYGPDGRATWQPTDRASLTYEEVCEQYRQALAARNPVVTVSAGTDFPAREQQAQAWQTATQALLRSLRTEIPDADFVRFTVWKHPLLGVLTAREMIYFTNYHTERHNLTLRAKQIRLV